VNVNSGVAVVRVMVYVAVAPMWVPVNPRPVNRSWSDKNRSVSYKFVTVTVTVSMDTWLTLTAVTKAWTIKFVAEGERVEAFRERRVRVVSKVITVGGVAAVGVGVGTGVSDSVGDVVSDNVGDTVGEVVGGDVE